MEFLPSFPLEISGSSKLFQQRYGKWEKRWNNLRQPSVGVNEVRIRVDVQNCFYIQSGTRSLEEVSFVPHVWNIFRILLHNLQLLILWRPRNNLSKCNYLGGVPHPWWGIPQSCPGGTLSWPCQAVPHPDRAGGTGTGVPPWEGTWDQSLGYPPERTGDQLRYYGMYVGGNDIREYRATLVEENLIGSWESSGANQIFSTKVTLNPLLFLQSDPISLILPKWPYLIIYSTKVTQSY